MLLRPAIHARDIAFAALVARLEAAGTLQKGETALLIEDIAMRVDTWPQGWNDHASIAAELREVASQVRAYAAR